VWQKLRRADAGFWGVLAVAFGAVCLVLFAIFLSASRYRLWEVPVSAWYVFILCGLILGLSWLAAHYRRLWRKAGRDLVQANLQLPAQLLPAVCGHARLPTPEYVPLIQALFRPPPQITYIQLEPLAGGYGGSSTLEARLLDAGSEEPLSQRFVIKLGRRDTIEGEAENYERFVSTALVGQEALHRQATWGDYAGIAYRFVSLAPGSTIMTFGEFYSSAQSDNESIALVRQTCERLRDAWYSRGRTVKRDLFAEYSLLAEKQDPIKQAVMTIVDQDDPYCRTNLSQTEPPWPNRQPAFCRQPDFGWHDPLAFLHQWRQQHLALDIHRATIHGDLNARNVLIEIGKDGRRHPWFIDFSHTGNGFSAARRRQAPVGSVAADQEQGHTLRDFCRLEADLKFIVTRLENPADLELGLGLEAALLRYSKDWRTFPDEPPPGDAFADRRFRKAWHVIAAIRQQAAQYLADPADPRPYLFGLLNATLPVVYYQAEQFDGLQCERQQKRFALLAAGMLCYRLTQ